jgi:hypothetical protein
MFQRAYKRIISSADVTYFLISQAVRLDLTSSFSILRIISTMQHTTDKSMDQKALAFIQSLSDSSNVSDSVETWYCIAVSLSITLCEANYTEKSTVLCIRSM